MLYQQKVFFCFFFLLTHIFWHEMEDISQLWRLFTSLGWPKVKSCSNCSKWQDRNLGKRTGKDCIESVLLARNYPEVSLSRNTHGRGKSKVSPGQPRAGTARWSSTSMLSAGWSRVRLPGGAVAKRLKMQAAAASIWPGVSRQRPENHKLKEDCGWSSGKQRADH